MKVHLVKLAQLPKSDLLSGDGYAPMPNALYKKYPSASFSFGWQNIVPSTLKRPRHDSLSQTRWHASPST